MDKPKVGDYYVRSWGYDQTNVNFYRVVDLTPSGKSVRVVEVWQKEVTESTVIPTETPREDSEPMTKRIGAGNRIAINDYDHAYPWNGKPSYRTPWWAGH